MNIHDMNVLDYHKKQLQQAEQAREKRLIAFQLTQACGVTISQATTWINHFPFRLGEIKNMLLIHQTHRLDPSLLAEFVVKRLAPNLTVYRNQAFKAQQQARAGQGNNDQ